MTLDHYVRVGFLNCVEYALREIVTVHQAKDRQILDVNFILDYYRPRAEPFLVVQIRHAFTVDRIRFNRAEYSKGVQRQISTLYVIQDR